MQCPFVRFLINVVIVVAPLAARAQRVPLASPMTIDGSVACRYQMRGYEHYTFRATASRKEGAPVFQAVDEMSCESLRRYLYRYKNGDDWEWLIDDNLSGSYDSESGGRLGYINDFEACASPNKISATFWVDGQHQTNSYIQSWTGSFCTDETTVEPPAGTELTSTIEYISTSTAAELTSTGRGEPSATAQHSTENEATLVVDTTYVEVVSSSEAQLAGADGLSSEAQLAGADGLSSDENGSAADSTEGVPAGAVVGAAAGGVVLLGAAAFGIMNFFEVGSNGRPTAIELDIEADIYDENFEDEMADMDLDDFV